jgi:sugar phosphate isomerase/epimerase
VIDVRTWQLPFRVGATSYIIPAGLAANAEFLAPVVQDMQLVLFDVPGGPSNLPNSDEVAALAALGEARDLSYTVHLLEDLRPDDEGSSPAAAPASALAKARQVIELTWALAPYAWVCHLDGRPVRALDPAAPQVAQWQAETAAALQLVCGWAGDGRRIAVENLEGYAPDFVAPVVARTAAGRCFDAGHLWLDGIDPLPHLAAALPRLRVVHLHGVRPVPSAGHSRDHSSLAFAAPAALDAVLHTLLAAAWDGVLCLEIFGEDDFYSSLHALGAAVRRVRL